MEANFGEADQKWEEYLTPFTDLYENKALSGDWGSHLWWVFRIASVHVHLKAVSVLT